MPTASPTSDAGSASSLWSTLVAFSGKTNQERQRYVADVLFPRAGLQPQLQPVPYHGPWTADQGNWDNLSNVWAMVPGSLPADQRRIIIVGAHFDKATYPGLSRKPGRSDGILKNATGVTVLAHVAEMLRQPRHDVIFVSFASEEPDPYLLGSKAFFGAAQDLDRVALFINLAVLGKGNLALVTGYSDERAAELVLLTARELGQNVEWRQSSTLTNSDQVTGYRNGLPVLAITCSGYEETDIHVPDDMLPAVDRQAFTNQFRIIARSIARIDLSLAPRGRS